MIEGYLKFQNLTKHPPHTKNPWLSQVIPQKVLIFH